MYFNDMREGMGGIFVVSQCPFENPSSTHPLKGGSSPEIKG